MADLESINFQSISDLQRSFVTVFKNSLHDKIGLTIIIAGMIVTVFLGVFVPKGFLVIVPLSMIFFIYLNKKTSALKNDLWIKFAKDNGWEIDNTAQAVNLIPQGLQYGSGWQFTPVVHAAINESSIEFTTFTTAVNKGRDSVGFTFVVACVNLPQPVPHFVLKSKNGSNLQNDFKDAQEIKLEGDFNNYFSLKIEKNSQIDVLQILSPDVMQSLIDNEQSEDIEAIGSKLCIILPLHVGIDSPSPAQVKYVFRSAVTLNKQILENIH